MHACWDFSDESIPEDLDSGAEVSEDEPTMVTPLRDDAVITNSLHKGGVVVGGGGA